MFPDPGEQRKGLRGGGGSGRCGKAPAGRAAGRILRMLALAHHVERLIGAGELSDYAEAARILGLTKARLTQVMNLLLLTPGAQEAILNGEARASERSLRRVVHEPAWSRQGKLRALQSEEWL